MEILAQSKSALDAAMQAKMVQMSTQLDGRCKRQASAVAATQAAIVECEAGIAAADSAQQDMLKQDDKRKR